MKRREPTTHKKHRAIWILAYCLVVAATVTGQATAMGLDVPTKTVILEFEEGRLIATPAAVEGYLQVQTIAGVEKITALPGVLQLQHCVRAASGVRELKGPYRVTIIEAQFEKLQFPLLDPIPHVAYITDDENGELIGENSAAWFPPQDKLDFCTDDQKVWHWAAAPTLRPEEVIEGDPCSYLNWNSVDADMDMPQAWAITRGSPAVLIAVLDNGFDWKHPEFGAEFPPYACTTAESLFYFSSGVFYTNPNEQPGDASGDPVAVPGVANYDDDHDGIIDEDSLGRGSNNDAEADVIIGEVDDVVGKTIYDYSASWPPGSLVNRWLYIDGGNVLGTRVRIQSNTINSVTTDSFCVVIEEEWPPICFDDWSSRFNTNPTYRIGDGFSNNEVVEDHWIDDEGWLNDLPNDDDENGAEDDVHGYDFYDDPNGGGASACAHEDYTGVDNDVFTHGSHGSGMLTHLATVLSAGRLMGAAPNIKVLPVRVGANPWASRINRCDGGGFSPLHMAEGIRYALTFHPDIIVTAMGPNKFEVVADALSAAGAAGVVCVNGAGNSGPADEHWLAPIEPPVVLVGGTNQRGEVWDEWVVEDPGYPPRHNITSYGPFVTVSARAAGLRIAVPWGSRYDTQSGTSFAGPIVAGIAALVKSAYPHMQRDDIIWMLKRGVDPIVYQDPIFVGKLGTGRVNGYRALTLYGNVAVGADTTWTHELWVGGDVLVPAGKTLTLAAGTTVNVAIDDLLSAGASGTQVEFVINGTMIIEGTPSAPVTFKVFEEGGESTEYVFNTVVSSTTFTMDNLPSQVAKYVNVSGGSGLSYTGAPYAAVALDYNGDGRGDLLTTSMDDFVRLFLGRAPSSEDPDAPTFMWSETLPSPPTGARAVVVGDYDNDGDEDIFVAHGTTPKLYHNLGGSFADSTAALGLAGLADMSMAASWFDYDRDGWLDLYVVRGTATGAPTCASVGGLQHRLFRNATRNGAGFVDVTEASGLTGIADIASLSVCASDIDGDHDMDLFVAAASSMGVGANSLLLMNDGAGHLVDKMDDRVAGTVESCPAAEWADMDNDGNPDLVVASDSGAPRILYNSGTGTFLGDAEVLEAPEGQSSVKVFDQDLDGWLDVLTLPRNAQESCRLLTSLRGVGGSGFVETTRGAGLADLGSATAAVAGDFNGDGDPDLFLGRPTASSKFMYRCGDHSGGAAPEHNYLKLKLNAPEFANNAQGIGARVSVFAGELVQTRSPDGGSGRGSQGDRTLVFGLGDYDGPISAKVTWPGGWETSVSWPTPPATVQIITDDTTPAVNNALTTCLADPSTGDLTWEFTWDTSVSCDPALDVVTLEQVGLPCLPGYTTLTVGSGIAHTYESKASGGYRHKFILVESCFAGCKMKYTMTSLVGPRGTSSPQQSKRIDACLSPQ